MIKAWTVIVLALFGLVATGVITGSALVLLTTRSLPNLLQAPGHSWLIFGNAAADSLIALSYIAIFLTLFWLGDKLRRSPGVRRYMWVCASFGVFILACGATHAMQGVVPWLPFDGLLLAVKLFSAATALVAACLLVSRISPLAHSIERLFDLHASEHRQAAALRKSEALLDRTNQIAGIGGWELDLLTMEVTWAHQTARLHGLPIGYKPSLEEGIRYYAPEVQPTLQAAIEAAISEGSGWDLEVPLIRVDGRRIWVRLIGEVEVLEGKPVRIFGSLQDKTVEIEQREALRRSQVFLDRTNKVAGIGGWELDLITKDLLWSDETARIHGKPSGYKPTYEESLTFFPQEYHASILATVENALATGGGYELELPLFRSDGSRIWVSLLGEVQSADGKPVRIFGSIQDKTEEIEQREALRKSQDFLDRTTRISGVGGWEVDIATETVTWSAETYRLHALPETYVPSVATGISFYAVQDRPVIAAAVERALETGEPWDLELQFIRADDKPIWVRTAGSVEMKDGRPVRIVGAFQDKTAQVNARLALTLANKRASLATDSGGIAIWDWDLATNQFICDQWMFRIYGLEPRDEPTPLSLWVEQLHPEDRPLVMAAISNAIEGIAPYDMEFRVLWADGATHIIKATGQVIRDENGRALHLIGTNRDVTEAHRLAAELAQQHELLRVTLLSIGDAVVSKDIHRNIVWMNGAAERMTGWTAFEATGRPVAEVFNVIEQATRLPADIYANSDTPKARRIAMGEKVLLVSRDRVERNIETCATPIYDNRAQFVGSVLVIRDVTEQFQLAREMEQIGKLQTDLKLKDEFLSHVSHELRSPLTSVYSFTSIVADNLAGDTTAEQQEYLQIVLKNVLQLQAMIEDLLTVTQSREGKLPIDFQNVDISSAILDALDSARHATSTRRISITSGSFTHLPKAWSDPTRLRQIMIILLDNAIKFTPEEGHIDIRVIEDDAMLRFEVEDDGCGIPLEKRARVFEKLYQITAAGHADTSQQGRIGLGLGLHIARDLVRRQGGNIWVTGDPNEGSVFNFTLPMASEAAERASAPLRRKADWPESVDKQWNPAA